MRLAHSGTAETPGIGSSLDTCILRTQPGLVEVLGTTALYTGVPLQIGTWEPRGLQISPFLDLGGGEGGVYSPKGVPEDLSYISLSVLPASLHPLLTPLPSSSMFIFLPHPCLVPATLPLTTISVPPLPLLFDTLVSVFSSFLFCSCLPTSGHPPRLFLSTFPDPCLCFLSSASLSLPPGPLRPGSDDAGVLVPKPLCPPHCAADQEDTTEAQQRSPEAQRDSLATGLKPDSPPPAVCVVGSGWWPVWVEVL